MYLQQKAVVMKRSILILLIFCFAIPFSSAQLWKMRRWELTAGAGPSFFFGDIGGYSRTKNFLGFRDMSYLQTRYDINANVKYRLGRKFNVRGSLTYGLFHATDERGSNESRPFEASTTIFEPALIGEYYFIKNRAESSYLFVKRREPVYLDSLKISRFLWFCGYRRNIL